MTRGPVPQPTDFGSHGAFLEGLARWQEGKPPRRTQGEIHAAFARGELTAREAATATIENRGPVRLQTFVAVGLFLAACVALGWYLLDGRVP